MLRNEDISQSSILQLSLASEARDEMHADALKKLIGRASNTPPGAKSAPGKPPEEAIRSPSTRRNSLYAKNNGSAPGIIYGWDDELELSPPDEAFLSWAGLCVDVQGYPLRFLLVQVRVFGSTPAGVSGRR